MIHCTACEKREIEGLTLVIRGRVNIIPNAFEDYYDCLAPDNPWHQDRPKPGRKIFWRTYPLFTETVTSKPKWAETVLVQGCENGRHVLELRNVKGRLGIGKLVVHEPPKKECK